MIYKGDRTELTPLWSVFKRVINWSIEVDLRSGCETSVTNSSPFRDYPDPDDHTTTSVTTDISTELDNASCYNLSLVTI